MDNTECQGTWKDTFRTLGELDAQVLRCNECGDIWAIWKRQKRQESQVFPKGTTDRQIIDFILKGG